jgi:GNAT superfamily N-acetyltransferase
VATPQEIAALLDAYHTLGNEVIDEPFVRIVRNLDAPSIYDANFACRVRVTTEDALDGVLDRLDAAFGHCTHRQVHVDPETDAMVEARLVLDGYEPDPTIELVLPSGSELDLATSPPAVDLRLVESEDDWRELERLTRLDHEGEAARESREPWPASVTAAMVATKRAKAPALRFWLARADGVDCGFFSSWAGIDGLGLVEDLFTDADFRHRGIATALLVHCVADARAHGARAVVIGARPDDTPRRMYAAMGFRPACVLRKYLLRTRR